jgi:biotin carboxyl carrier protein
LNYFVTIEGREIPVEVDGDRVTVGGREVRAHLSVVPGTPVRHLLVDAESLALVVEQEERGVWRLAVQGTTRVASVVDERTRHIRSLAGDPGQTAGPSHLKAPMPGLVVRLLAREGEAVDAGRGLVVLEAMKMENELRAAAPGVVASIRVTPGQAVEKGQVLIEFVSVAGGAPPLT